MRNRFSRLCMSLVAGIMLLSFGNVPGMAEAGRAAGRVIVIDPGHGGAANSGSDAARNQSSSNNATSPGKKILEKELTLELAKATVKELRARHPEIRVVLTREGDSNPNFSERAAAAKSAGAACYVAIHFNAANGRVSGPRAIVQQSSKNPNFAADRDFGMALARAVGKATARFRPTPEASFHDDHELHSGFGSYLFHQMNQDAATRAIPTCHLEVEFLDNAAVERDLFGARRNEVIGAWASALADALAQRVGAR